MTREQFDAAVERFRDAASSRALEQAIPRAIELYAAQLDRLARDMVRSQLEYGDRYRARHVAVVEHIAVRAHAEIDS